jgi:hypothetical protein
VEQLLRRGADMVERLAGAGSEGNGAVAATFHTLKLIRALLQADQRCAHCHMTAYRITA